MNLLNLEEEKFKTIKIQGLDFKIRHISVKDEIEINRRRNKLQAGCPIESLTEDEFNLYYNISVVDICVEEVPKELEEFKFSSCIMWDNKEMITELAADILKHTGDLKERLKKNKPLD